MPAPAFRPTSAAGWTLYTECRMHIVFRDRAAAFPDCDDRHDHPCVAVCIETAHGNDPEGPAEIAFPEIQCDDFTACIRIGVDP